MALDFEEERLRQSHFGQILEEKLCFQETTFWYALNYVEPSLSWLSNRKWPRAISLVSIMIIVFCACSPGHKVSVCAQARQQEPRITARGGFVSRPTLGSGSPHDSDFQPNGNNSAKINEIPQKRVNGCKGR